MRHLSAPLVAAHLDELKATLRQPRVKVHMAALEHRCSKLVLSIGIDRRSAWAARRGADAPP
jgi:hypothetical protein